MPVVPKLRKLGRRIGFPVILLCSAIFMTFCLFDSQFIWIKDAETIYSEQVHTFETHMKHTASDTQLFSDFKSLALSNVFFNKTWSLIEESDPRTWTITIRTYATMFRFWRMVKSEKKFSYSTEVDDIMHKINHKLYPWLKSHANTMELLKSYHGRGIVMSVGNGQANFASVTITHLRTALNCSLPIEIFYIDNNDLSAANINALSSLPNIRVLNLQNMVDKRISQLGGWSAKPYALLMSSFQEAILMDADVIFLQDPAILFDEPLFKIHGTLFYKDRTLFGSPGHQKWLKQFLPKPWSATMQNTRFWKGLSAHEMESGVVVYNKDVRFIGILATAFINVGKLKDYFYKHVHGDKETFWIGPEMAQEPYGFTKYGAGAIGPRLNNTSSTDVTIQSAICSPQLLHTDEKGKCLWFNQWIFRNRFEDNPVFEDFNVWVTEDAGGHFELKESNICCFNVTKGNEHKITEVTKEESRILEKAKEIWQHRS